jgi:hypothetical protein
MLLSRSTFNEVRTDTYALFVNDLGLYYYYVKALLKEFMTTVETLDTTDISDAESTLNSLLVLIRNTHTGRSRILSVDVQNVLTDQGLDYDDLSAIYKTGFVEIEGHSSTNTIKCPLLISKLSASKISSTREAITPRSDLLQIDEELSEYLSAEAVATLVGGTVSKKVLATGTDAESLREYIQDFKEPEPVRARVNMSVLIPTGSTVPPFFETRDLEFNFVVTNDGTANTAINEDSSVNSWIVTQNSVNLGTQGIGTSGPMFEYPLSTSMVDNSLSLRAGMCLESDTGITVNKVLGERVALSSPVSMYGVLKFVYKAHLMWSKYLPLLSNVVVTGDTEEDQRNSLLFQSQKKARACKSLLASIPSSTNNLRFDIRAAHHAVGADYAYNLLERGRLIEYHQLTEQQANRGNIMSTAAAHIRAGTRL